MICSYSGNVKLLNQDFFPIRNLRYFTRKHRERIIHTWEKEIGKERINEYILQICPDVELDNEHKNGMLEKKIKRINKNKHIPCQQIELKKFMLTTFAQYKIKNSL